MSEIPTDDNHEAFVTNDDDQINDQILNPKKRLSKLEKKIEKERKRKEYWKAHRSSEKANKKKKKAELMDPLSKEFIEFENRSKLKKRNFEELIFSPYHVIIDLGFDSEMTEKVKIIFKIIFHFFRKLNHLQLS